MSMCVEFSTPSHSSFSFVQEKLRKWLDRFPFHDDQLLLNELTLFYLFAPKKHLDHREPIHCFRSILSIYSLQKQLLNSITFYPETRHIKMRWLPTELFFPFSSKPALGCAVGINVMSRYELFDKENVILALEKHFPLYSMVQESFYYHPTKDSDVKIFYFEIERKDGVPLSLAERLALKDPLQEKIKNSIQLLSPVIFTSSNEEEVYKNILALSREIDSVDDPPQAFISLDHHSDKEMAFRIILVYSAPYHNFSLKKRFHGCTFVSERICTIRHIAERPIEAHIFRLLFPRDFSCLRSDGSLDFYTAREKAVAAIRAAIGDFRDYNGGILCKQQELYREFKHSFPEFDSDLLINFFYTLMPLEKRAVLQLTTLCDLFSHFAKAKDKILKDRSYSLERYSSNDDFFLIIRTNQSSCEEVIAEILQKATSSNRQMVYNYIRIPEGTFFNCIFPQIEKERFDLFLETLQKELYRWQQNNRMLQTLRIGGDQLPYCLDPRVGGDIISGNILKLLFEGLTRFDRHGNLENGLAQSIEISTDAKRYIFKLRSSVWNDGSPVTAYDFEYSWKKILSPSFVTAFARMFYSIKHAREAKEGKLSADEVGIKAVDEWTLHVELANPVPYFLQLTALPLFAPVHRGVDQQSPQWPYQCGTNYPCNGPFQPQIHQPTQRYQFIKNPHYWDTKQIALDQIIIKQMNARDSFLAFQKDELDWIGNPLGSWNASYLAESQDHLLTLPSQAACWMALNTQSPLMQCRKLREAILFSIDRDELCTSSPFTLFPAYTLDPPSSNHLHHLFPRKDEKKARQLFEEALEELGIDKEHFPSLVLLFYEKGIRQYAADRLKSQLKDVLNIDCDLIPLPWSQFWDRALRGQFHICLTQWISAVDDPSYTLNDFRFITDGTNFAKWESSDLQRLLDRSDQELNPFQRSSHLLEAEKVVAREVPLIPLFFQPYQSLVKHGWDTPLKDTPGFFNFSRMMKFGPT